MAALAAELEATRALYRSTLAELEEAQRVKDDSRGLLNMLEENFSAASQQYEGTLEVGVARARAAQASMCHREYPLASLSLPLAVHMPLWRHRVRLA